MHFLINGHKGLQFEKINLWNTLVFVKKGTLATLRAFKYVVLVGMITSFLAAGWYVIWALAYGHINYKVMSDTEIAYVLFSIAFAAFLPWLLIDYLRISAIKAIVSERNFISSGRYRTRYITDKNFSYQALFPEGSSLDKLDPNLLALIAATVEYSSEVYDIDKDLLDANDLDIAHRHLGQRRIIRAVRLMYETSEFGTPEILAALDKLRAEVDTKAIEAGEINVKQLQHKQAALEGFVVYTKENALTI